MPGPHPTDSRLADFIDGQLDTAAANNVQSHVLDCARCQLRIGSAERSARGPKASEESAAVAIQLLEEVRDEAPSKGDVWRLAWDDTVLLAVVWRAGSERISILPVAEPGGADEWSALLGGNGSGGMGNIAVGVALETAVPWSVLDARVAQLPDVQPLALLRAEYRTGVGSEGTARGQPILSPLDDRLVESDSLAERLSVLANAVWAPVVAVAAAAEFTYDSLQAAGLPANRALAISRRGAAPTDDEADKIEAAIGVRPPSQPVDDELRRKIDSPFRKAKIRSRARANRHGEAQERLLLARAAEPAAFAARGTFGQALDYDDVLDRLLGD